MARSFAKIGVTLSIWCLTSYVIDNYVSGAERVLRVMQNFVGKQLIGTGTVLLLNNQMFIYFQPKSCSGLKISEFEGFLFLGSLAIFNDFSADNLSIVSHSGPG